MAFVSRAIGRSIAILSASAAIKGAMPDCSMINRAGANGTFQSGQYHRFVAEILRKIELCFRDPIPVVLRADGLFGDLLAVNFQLLITHHGLLDRRDQWYAHLAVSLKPADWRSE